MVPCPPRTRQGARSDAAYVIARQRNHLQLHHERSRVPSGSFWEGDKHEPFAIRRAMREPVLFFLALGHLLRKLVFGTALPRAFANLPLAGTIGIEVDPFAIGRESGPSS